MKREARVDCELFVHRRKSVALLSCLLNLVKRKRKKKKKKVKAHMKKRERAKKTVSPRRAKCYDFLLCSSFPPEAAAAESPEEMFGTKKKRQMEGGVEAPASESGSVDGSIASSGGEEDTSKSALSNFKAKEEEIERRKMEVRERLQAQLSRVEEETKRLAFIRGELEALADPMRKEVTSVGKRIDCITRELKPLGVMVQKKEKEYRDVLNAFNDKNKEKAQLINKLVELVGESELVRMKKLEELSKSVDCLDNL